MLFKNKNYDFSKWGLDDNTIFVEVHRNKDTIQKRLDDGMYNCWNKDRIKQAFRNGNGTIEDFLAYVKRNSDLIDFIEMLT